MLVGGFIAIHFLVELALAERNSKNVSVFFSVGPSEKEGMLPGVPNGHCGN